MGSAIADFYADMAVLSVQNSQTDHIVWSARVVLWVVVGPLTMQRAVGTCCYLLHRLLGTQCFLVEALPSQVANAINK